MAKRKTGKKKEIQLPWDKWTHLPDLETDPKRWLEETDKITKERFDPSQPLPEDWDRIRAPSEYEFDDEALREMMDLKRFWCNAHLGMSQHLTYCLTEKDFEQEWLDLGESAQEEMILSAFQQVNSHDDPMHMLHGPQKLYCPELCLDELLKDSGNGYLDLLKAYLLDNNDDPPTQPFILVNERFDEMISWREDDPFPARKASLMTRRLMRTRYISTIIGVVLASVYGKEIQFRTVASEHNKTKEALERMRPVIEGAGLDFKKWARGEASRRMEQKLFCNYCLKPENKAENGKMAACSKCSAVGRQVRYCGKECQRKAWKAHKPECGRPLDVADVFQEHTPRRDNLPSLRPDIPPVTAGYKRSPDLLRLISFMNEHPKYDYVFGVPGTEELDAMTLDELPSAATFIIMRNRAMSSGDEPALFYVYRVLQRWHDGPGLDKQLKKEYGKPVENMLRTLAQGRQPAGPAEVQREDVDQALRWLKEAGRFKEELEDYEPGSDGKVQKLGVQVGPKKDLMVVVNFPIGALPPPVMVDVAVSPSTGASRTERRNRLRLTSKDASSSSMLGPNHGLPDPVNFVRSPALEKQINFLQMNPEADYILWGKSDDPSTAYTVQFQDMMACVAFLAYRRRIFARGAYDIDALVYLIMALEPAVRRRKISKEAILTQFSAEYGADYVAWANDSIKGKLYRRRDGKMFTLGEIPLLKDGGVEEMKLVTRQLKAVGRFRDVLSGLKT